MGILTFILDALRRLFGVRSPWQEMHGKWRDL